MEDKITVVKEFIFDAAHRLPGYSGACERLHGHTYRLQVGICPLQNVKYLKEGMVVDFALLKSVIEQDIIFALDHEYLNEITWEGFPNKMPTCENMVLWMRDVISKRWKARNVNSWVAFIRLYETPTSYAEWSR